MRNQKPFLASHVEMDVALAALVGQRNNRPDPVISIDVGANHCRSLKVRIKGLPDGVARMMIAAEAVGLPHVKNRSRNRAALLRRYLPMQFQDDALRDPGPAGHPCQVPVLIKRTVQRIKRAGRKLRRAAPRERYNRDC